MVPFQNDQNKRQPHTADQLLLRSHRFIPEITVTSDKSQCHYSPSDQISLACNPTSAKAAKILIPKINK